MRREADGGTVVCVAIGSVMIQEHSLFSESHGTQALHFLNINCGTQWDVSCTL